MSEIDVVSIYIHKSCYMQCDVYNHRYIALLSMHQWWSTWAKVIPALLRHVWHSWAPCLEKRTTRNLEKVSWYSTVFSMLSQIHPIIIVLWAQPLLTLKVPVLEVDFGKCIGHSKAVPVKLSKPIVPLFRAVVTVMWRWLYFGRHCKHSYFQCE